MYIDRYAQTNSQKTNCFTLLRNIPCSLFSVQGHCLPQLLEVKEWGRGGGLGRMKQYKQSNLSPIQDENTLRSSVDPCGFFCAVLLTFKFTLPLHSFVPVSICQAALNTVINDTVTNASLYRQFVCLHVEF